MQSRELVGESFCIVAQRKRKKDEAEELRKLKACLTFAHLQGTEVHVYRVRKAQIRLHYSAIRRHARISFTTFPYPFPKQFLHEILIFVLDTVDTMPP